MMRDTTRTLFAVLATAAIAVGSASPATAQVPAATLVGPIAENVPPGDPSHDYIYFTPVEDLSDFGYLEEEYFAEGAANRYSTPSLATGSVVSSGHPWRTRVVVRRPIKKYRANGIILFEWQNVSAGYELDAHWTTLGSFGAKACLG